MCCTFDTDNTYMMTRALHYAVGLLPTKHRLSYRPLQGPPRTQATASNALHATASPTGRACIPRREVRCQSYQGQRAHAPRAGPDISELDPALQQQWDHAANAQLGDLVIKPQSNKKVWWICDRCPDGHEHRWSARVADRPHGNGCPQCIGRQVCKHNSLATKAPLVAAQWDFEANSGSPDDVVAQSNSMAKWRCEVCACKWEATPNARVCKSLSGCPQCADIAKSRKLTRHPTFAECIHPLLAEWDHERNAAQGHYPDKISLKSNKQIFWLCTKCPAGQKHSWSAMPTVRTARSESGCSVCAGHTACRCNSLQALYPDAAADWDYSQNQGQPSDYTASSSYLAWWSSLQRGSWQQTIHSRTCQVRMKALRLKHSQQRQHSARNS